MPDHPSPDANPIFTRFEKLLAALASGNVDFAIVGGVAVLLNGYARLTVDVDIIVARNAENLRRLLDVLAQWGEGFARELSPADFIGEEGCVRVSEEFDLDIFTTMSGRTLDDFRPRLRHLDSAGGRIPYISPEDIISLKQSSWRDKDQLDVRAMRQAIAREEQ